MKRSTLVRSSVGIALSLAMLASPPLLVAATAKQLEPMIVGWENFFKLQWEVGEQKGKPVLRGYLINDSPYDVHSIQLLVEGLDDAGQVMGQRVQWLPGTLTPFNRAYFVAMAPTTAPKYRVRVYAYDRFEAPQMRK